MFNIYVQDDLGNAILWAGDISEWRRVRQILREDKLAFLMGGFKTIVTMYRKTTHR